MQRWSVIVLAAGIALAAPAAVAGHHHHVRQVRYVGIHPIPKSEGGGICYIEVPHVHVYAADKLEYRDHDGDHYFVGDPIAYGWDGPRYVYDGPHPIHVDAVVGGEPDTVWCYLRGPHYHYFAPPEGPDFKLAGHAYFYVGDPPQAFLEARPTYAPINAYYQPLTYVRPVVTVDAPTGWIGARAELVGPIVDVSAHPRAVEHRAAVVAPGVAVGAEVHIPVPSVHIGLEIGGPSVIVHDRPVIIEHGHHDHGRHRGWHKHHGRR